ncbi:undecaprenyldiphospho-muramoylpentapeptide beta-N-acetylglucosaminyltransferase [Anaerococcus sp. AGMB00486]|uniref:UDP-N-acetylglucosamine--N-acetylmuramyl-(pentapeptide) pyrophosphoryl-undecaprenol N-acetylglucosamine transferase n=2 Tax=Anaerococcus TaxID=165779 RepID=A0ABX2NBY7_9FIRM|nr:MULTISPECIES: undecaprenyldiphospho-muramoylpentapeptide beta-N-acetylglucosaminyltransferase [Anaerococcus]MSS78224.1 undecaprenyldiphospho-muramoylpentapeptide beta-N-acetylglucosaminyltransferase [Anaerococcus porci]NVF11982.1 undecaprenyldiphospho-muramoylpentapeptide beta-N-acetylglucosaminyltransferase [Anaerococcus faecalis]
MKIIVSGGGTGGHIYPAIAICQKLEKEIDDLEILYVGIKGGPEEKIVKKYDYKFHSIEAMGLPRKISKRLFKSLITNLKGFSKAKKIINDFKPDLVIGTGGYVCAPIIYQASRKHIKTMIHESNSFPGITTRFLSSRVDAVCISFEEAKKHLKNKDNIYITGNPVRTNFNEDFSKKDLDKLGIKKDIPVVFSFGGSNGSYALNEAVKEMSQLMKGDFYLLHQTGNMYFENFKKEVYNNEFLKIFSYIDSIDLFYAVSDLVIASSGAMSLTEISSLKKASILIPKAYTTENHQEFNARNYFEHGASLMILEKDLTGQKLYDNIKEIINDKDKLKNMGEKANSLQNPKAADEIYNIIRKLMAS